MEAEAEEEAAREGGGGAHRRTEKEGVEGYEMLVQIGGEGARLEGV
jgi:hypothetical protein